MTPIFCKLARPGLKIPMPGGAIFAERGETVDADNPFIRRLISDGDLIVATETEESNDAKPAKRKG